MSDEKLKNLREGDIVSTAVCTVDITNAIEWTLVAKATHDVKVKDA